MINPWKLANEWRDSLLLTTTVAAAAAWPAHAVEIVLTPWFWRETAREWAWLWPLMSVAGVSINHPPSGVVMSACGLVAVLVLMAEILMTGAPMVVHALVFGILFPFRLCLVMSRCGSLKAAVDAYLSAWDWPRKRDGGGETRKLKQMIDMARPAAAGGAA